MSKFNSDIDIDLADRTQILDIIDHTSAAMRKVNPMRKHSTGVYITKIPYDPVYDMASIDYTEAENRGYFKLDLLNVYVYSLVKDENHLIELMQEPDWSLLNKRSFFEKIVHIGNHYKTFRSMPEPINSIPRLAMFLAVIRPAKKHLIGKTWKEIAKTVWEKEADGYSFKKAHAIGYSWLVAVHMNLLMEEVHTRNNNGITFS